MANMQPGNMAGLTYGTAMKNKIIKDQRPDNPSEYAYVGNSTPTSMQDYADKYKMNVRPPKENIGVNSSQMGYSMPYNATFMNNMPYTKDEYIASFQHDMNANDDEVKSQRFQELSAHADELKKRIMELKAEIAWQEKLREHEMSNDPMWTVAKHKYIYDNDASHLENIMNRKQQDKQLKSSQDLQREQINASKQETQESKDAAARRGRDYLTWTFNNYKTNPDDLQALDNLFAAKQKLEELAQDAGKQPEDYYNDTTLEEIDTVLNEGLKKKQEKVETAKKNAAAAKSRTAEDNEVKNILAEYNKSTHTRKDRQAKKKDLEKSYPNYTFTVKDGKIIPTRKAGK